MKVLFLTQYDINGPSSRIRTYQFLPFYEKQGIHCDVKPLISGPVKEMLTILLNTKNPFKRAWVCLKILGRFMLRYGEVLGAGKYDVVVVQKDVLPFGLQFLLRMVNDNFVYEFDDAIWQPSPDSNEKSILLKIIFRYRRHLFHKLLRTAKVVVAENSYLEKYSKKFNNDVEVISAPIDTDKYVSKGKKEGGKVVVGWLGSPMTSYLLKMLEKPLNELAKKVPNLEIHNFAGKPMNFSGVNVKNIPWDEQREVEYLSAFDVGVMPLDDIEFNKGRLGYKVILYSSMGIPSVADNVGLNSEIVKNGVTGYLVKGDKEWTDKLLYLIEHPDLRTKMGAEARKFVVRTFDLKICAEKYANIFHRLSGVKTKTAWPMIVARYHLGKHSKLSAIESFFNRYPFSERTSALDIGVGTGGLAATYHSHAGQWLNVEPEHRYADVASKLLSENVLPSLDDVGSQKFDLIAIIDTLFYFTDPDFFIRKLHNHLNSGGKVLVTLTNGDNTLILNRLRNAQGLGLNARGIAFEESRADVIKRFETIGFRTVYCREFCFPAEEAILLVIDNLVIWARGLGKKRQIDQIVDKEINGLSLWLLKISWIILKTLSLLDYPFRPFLTGYRFITVFEKK